MEKVNSLKKKSITISQSGTTSFSSIIGRSARIQEAISLARKVSATNATVLLLGETGTGKEVFAKAIHGASNRNTGSFVAINCSAFTRELLEGELFGHKAGAFTGALKDKKGLFEVANDGTLFLDEIGEMHIDLQAKLLRVLDNGEFIKLGDTRVTIVNTRIIAATNRNLQKEANEGLFREDLFYRLNTFTISLPPLRERKEDIKELTGFFLASFGKRENKDLKISAEALEALEQYTWKGNIRELRNVMERANNIISFAVSDHGNGIEEKYLDQIFERYFQVPGRPDTRGTGIGLAISKDFIEAMGGKIWVKSQVGQGSTFGFDFPYASKV